MDECFFPPLKATIHIHTRYNFACFTAVFSVCFFTSVKPSMKKCTGAAQYFFHCLTYDALKLLGAQFFLQLVSFKLRIQIGSGSLL